MDAQLRWEAVVEQITVAIAKAAGLESLDIEELSLFVEMCKSTVELTVTVAGLGVALDEAGKEKWE